MNLNTKLFATKIFRKSKLMYCESTNNKTRDRSLMNKIFEGDFYLGSELLKNIVSASQDRSDPKDIAKTVWA